VKIERRERTMRAQAMQLETTMMWVVLTLSSFRGSGPACLSLQPLRRLGSRRAAPQGSPPVEIIDVG